MKFLGLVGIDQGKKFFSRIFDKSLLLCRIAGFGIFDRSFCPDQCSVLLSFLSYEKNVNLRIS